MAGYFQLTNQHHGDDTKSNGTILIECKGLQQVISSSAEAEIGGIYHNAQHALPIQVALEALGHPQSPTRIKSDNSTAHGFIYSNINMKRSKSWDMRYHCLSDQENQGQFEIYWKPGPKNDGDYWTKHQPILHHRTMRPRYVHDEN